MNSSKYSRNIWIIYLFNFFRGSMFLLPIYTLYLNQELFTAVNVTTIIAIQTFCSMIFEIPTGAIADLFGRKNTLIVSGIVAVVALIFLSIGGSILIFILYAILMALAGSLTSGTDSALLFDSLKASRKDIDFQKVITWSTGAWQSGAIVGSLIGGMLATISLRLPIILTIIPFSLALLSTFFIIEPPYKKEAHKNISIHMRDTVKMLIKNKLLVLFFVTILLFAFSEVPFSFNPVFYDFKQIPIIYFGVISALAFGVGFLGSIISSHYLGKKWGDKNVLLLSAIVVPGLIFTATFMNNFWAVLLMILSSFFWSMRLPIILDMFNKKTPSKKRATTLSVAGFGSVLGMMIYAPIFGRMVDVLNVSMAMRWTAVFTIVAIILVLFVKE